MTRCPTTSNVKSLQGLCAFVRAWLPASEPMWGHRDSNDRMHPGCFA